MNSRSSHPASLAILCGGKSTRLGSDKGLYNPLGDEPLFARAIRLLGESFSERLIVVRDEQQAARYRDALLALKDDSLFNSTRIICDVDVDPQAPFAAISGIRTALCESSQDIVVAVPVDCVGVRIVHLNLLIARFQGTAASCFGSGNELEAGMLPFPSVWRRGALPTINSQIMRGQLGVRKAIAELGGAVIEAGGFATELDVNPNTGDELRTYFGQPLIDPFGRRLHYLRFSLTEACNMSCVYCLPDGFPEWHRHKARLSTGNIQTLLSGFRQLGFRKVRFTGGEPTVHPGCLDAIHTARRLGFEEIALTSNGLLLGDIRRWTDAGLTQINISLDSVNPLIFKAITKSQNIDKVLSVIDQATALGLLVKINTVLMRSINGSDDQIKALVDWAIERPLTLRFIELMETKLNSGFAANERILGHEIERLLKTRGMEAAVGPKVRPNMLGPSTDFMHPEYPGKIGLINPMSCNFCNTCNRLRITARGELKLCLFGKNNQLLNLASADTVAADIRKLICNKPERHYLENGDFGNVATFRTIGG